jgi:predicted CXXCH cytochrome family protein
MGRHLILGLGSALLMTVGGAGSASADNGPHVSTAVGVAFSQLAGADACTSCHRANTTRTAFLPKPGQIGLCLTCHGPSAGGATTDVVDGVGYRVGGTQDRDGTTAPGALRAGGFEYALIGTAGATRETYLCGSAVRVRNQVIPVLPAPQAATSRHGRTSATGTAWPNSPLGSAAGAAVTLECGSCHDPHGNSSYRILRASPAGSGTSTAAAGVRIPDATVKVYTTTNYWLSGDTGVPSVVNGVKAGSAVPDGYTASIATWCATCHQRAHLDTTVKMVGTTCATCHVAHGSNANRVAASSSPVSQPDDPATPCRSSLLRIDSNQTVCVMCHNS